MSSLDELKQIIVNDGENKTIQWAINTIVRLRSSCTDLRTKLEDYNDTIKDVGDDRAHWKYEYYKSHENAEDLSAHLKAANEDAAKLSEEFWSLILSLGRNENIRNSMYVALAEHNERISGDD